MPLRAVRVCARTYDLRRASGRPNRWNAPGQFVLYLSEHFGTALLESMVHSGANAPLPSHASWVTIPDDVAVETLDGNSLPSGWDDPDDQARARAVGARWYRDGGSAVLVVPSVPGRPFESNVVINTLHPDAAMLRWDGAVEVPWDPRLF